VSWSLNPSILQLVIKWLFYGPSPLVRAKVVMLLQEQAFCFVINQLQQFSSNKVTTPKIDQISI